MTYNPIFDFMQEGWDTHNVFEYMGFDFVSIYSEEWEDDPTYSERPYEWMEAWQPDVPKGFSIVSMFDTEDGPCCWCVKPTTEFAKALLEFGFSDVAQKAAEKDTVKRLAEFNERIDRKRRELQAKKEDDNDQ